MKCVLRHFLAESPKKPHPQTLRRGEWGLADVVQLSIVPHPVCR